MSAQPPRGQSTTELSARKAADAERLAGLYHEIARLRTELVAVENGTLPWLEEHETATAAMLAEAFGCTVQAANNRLARMVGAGLATREPYMPDGGGRGYTYRVVRRWRAPLREVV